MTTTASSHRDVMVNRALSEGWQRGAELGVGSGHLFEALLQSCPDLHLIGVDTFQREERRARVRGIAMRFPGRCTIYPMTTGEAAALVPDESLDFVFIDAGHSYDAVRDDIRNWTPKVRADGWLGGHDYHPNHPGVMQAVNESFGPFLHLAEFAVWWVRR